jgi:hypothetical protein
MPPPASTSLIPPKRTADPQNSTHRLQLNEKYALKQQRQRPLGGLGLQFMRGTPEVALQNLRTSSPRTIRDRKPGSNAQ